MTSEEIISAAREIIWNYQNRNVIPDHLTWPKLVEKHGLNIASELIRLAAENQSLREDRNHVMNEAFDVEASVASALGWDLKGKSFSESIREIIADRVSLAAELAEAKSFSDKTLEELNSLRRICDEIEDDRNRIAVDLAKRVAALAEIKKAVHEHPCPNPKGLECHVCYMIKEEIGKWPT